MYFVLTKKSCSYDQWEYVLDKLPSKHGIEGYADTIQICNDGYNWFDESSTSKDDVTVSFNDIFIKQGEE